MSSGSDTTSDPKPCCPGLDTLYPPGNCGDSCSDERSFKCRTREMNTACCSLDGDCKIVNGSLKVPTSGKCGYECSLVLPEWLSDCRTYVEQNYSQVAISSILATNTKCFDQDPKVLLQNMYNLEYLQNCSVDTKKIELSDSKALKLTPASAGCQSLTDKQTCITSKDGRAGATWEGRRIHDEACIWCCGAKCTGPGSNKCEPADWVFGHKAFIGKWSSAYENKCDAGSGKTDGKAFASFKFDGDVKDDIGKNHGMPTITHQPCCPTKSAQDSCTE